MFVTSQLRRAAELESPAMPTAGWAGDLTPPWPISCPLLPPALLHHKALCNDSLFLHALPDTSMHCRPITIPQAAAWGSSAEHHNFAVQGQSQQ